MKSKLCARVDSYRIVDGTIFRGGDILAGCGGLPGDSYDNQTLIQQQCLAGAFEQINGNERTISIRQDCGRCSCHVSQESFDCMKLNYSE
jgi:hypothetical protein